MSSCAVSNFSRKYVIRWKQITDREMKRVLLRIKQPVTRPTTIRLPTLWRVFPGILIPCSHRRYGQDKTVLSCTLVRVGGLSKTADKTRQFCSVSTQLPISKFSVIVKIFKTKQLQVGNWVETRQICLVLSAVVFTPPTRTRRDKTVLTCLCRRSEIRVRNVEIISERKWLLNDVHIKLQMTFDYIA